jgi:hypothetical protein
MTYLRFFSSLLMTLVLLGNTSMASDLEMGEDLENRGSFSTPAPSRLKKLAPLVLGVATTAVAVYLIPEGTFANNQSTHVISSLTEGTSTTEITEFLYQKKETILAAYKATGKPVLDKNGLWVDELRYGLKLSSIGRVYSEFSGVSNLHDHLQFFLEYCDTVASGSSMTCHALRDLLGEHWIASAGVKAAITTYAPAVAVGVGVGIAAYAGFKLYQWWTTPKVKTQ